MRWKEQNMAPSFMSSRDRRAPPLKIGGGALFFFFPPPRFGPGPLKKENKPPPPLKLGAPRSFGHAIRRANHSSTHTHTFYFPPNAPSSLVLLLDRRGGRTIFSLSLSITKAPAGSILIWWGFFFFSSPAPRIFPPRKKKKKPPPPPNFSVGPRRSLEDM